MYLVQLKETQKAKVRVNYELHELKQSMERTQSNGKGIFVSNKDNNDSIINSLKEKIKKLSENIEKEKQDRCTVEESLRALTKGIESKDNETILFTKRLEELTQRKNKLQKESSPV